MILCHCSGVTDTTIKRLVAAGASSTAEVARLCGAGLRCPPCREAVAELVRDGAPSAASRTSQSQGREAALTAAA